MNRNYVLLFCVGRFVLIKRVLWNETIALSDLSKTDNEPGIIFKKYGLNIIPGLQRNTKLLQFNLQLLTERTQS